MEDIRKFLQAKVARQESEQSGKVNLSYQSTSDSTTNVENDSEWTDESDDSTLDGEDDLSCQSIGRNWQDKLVPADSENKENVGSAKMLEFSPPEKLPADPPSHLIWQIFGRETFRRGFWESIVRGLCEEVLGYGWESSGRNHWERPL